MRRVTPAILAGANISIITEAVTDKAVVYVLPFTNIRVLLYNDNRFL